MWLSNPTMHSSRRARRLNLGVRAPMTLSLSKAAPEFAAEVTAALESAGLSVHSINIGAATIERCTYDSEADAGYIYFVRHVPSLPFIKHGAPVAKTIPFLEPHWFNVDIDREQNIFGVEFLSRKDVAESLRRAGAL